MTNDDYKQAFSVEYRILCGRYVQWENMIKQAEAGEPIESQTPVELLKKHLEILHDLLVVYQERAKYEEVELRPAPFDKN